MSNLKKIVNYLKIINEIRLTGGISYDINTGCLNPKTGYMVSLPNHEQVVLTVDEEAVRSYINQHADALSQEGTYFGCWFDGDRFVLDVSRRYERKRDAVFYAIIYKQRAIWDNNARDEIRVNPRGSLVKQYIKA